MCEYWASEPNLGCHFGRGFKTNLQWVSEYWASEKDLGRRFSDVDLGFSDLTD